jgi:transcriptional regulator of aromatic amino acid metabolism
VSQYLSEIDPAGSTLASVEARIANIKNAIDFCVEKISSVGLTEQMKLDKISLDCRIELAELSNARKSAVLDSGESYLASLPKYEIGKGAAAGGAGFGVRSTDGWLDQAHDQMTEEQNGFDGDAFVNEQAPLFVSELPQQMVGDGAVVAAAAAEKAYERVAHLGIDVDAFVNGFVAAVESHRRTRLAAVKTEMKKSASAEFNGPDEALFM